MVRGTGMLVVLGSVLAAAALAVTAPSAASASASEIVLDPDVAAMLAEYPGGVLIDADSAVWPDLGMSIDVPVDGAALRLRALTPDSVGACATGAVCVFSGAGTSGTKVSWTTCPTQTFTTFAVGSIADAKSTGYFQALNGLSVVAQANAGTYVNVSSTVNKVHCVS